MSGYPYIRITVLGDEFESWTEAFAGLLEASEYEFNSQYSNDNNLVYDNMTSWHEIVISYSSSNGTTYITFIA